MLLLSEILGGIWNKDRDGANITIAIVVVIVVRVTIALCLSDSPKGGVILSF